MFDVVFRFQFSVVSFQDCLNQDLQDCQGFQDKRFRFGDHSYKGRVNFKNN